ncbi:hypothetical protein JL722_1858 [Aureococcus anophagefferens]|nr:hypothetical protein JL722_1858 [Aureococcus anophagefferens]
MVFLLQRMPLLCFLVVINSELTRNHADYTCWTSKLCGGEESKPWRKVICLIVAVYASKDLFSDLVRVGVQGPVSAMEAVRAVGFLFTPEAHAARLVAGLVVPQRHWSFSWNQLEDFVYACGHALCARELGMPCGHGDLAAYGDLLVGLGLIQVVIHVAENGTPTLFLCDGNVVLFVNKILSLGGHEQCKATPTLVLLIFFFFGIGDDDMRQSARAFIYAACHFGAMSMSGVHLLNQFFTAYDATAHFLAIGPIAKIVEAAGNRFHFSETAFLDDGAARAILGNQIKISTFLLKILGGELATRMLDVGFPSEAWAANIASCWAALEDQKASTSWGVPGFAWRAVFIFGGSLGPQSSRSVLRIKVSFASGDDAALRQALFGVIAVAFAFGEQVSGRPLRLPSWVSDDVISNAVKNFLKAGTPCILARLAVTIAAESAETATPAEPFGPRRRQLCSERSRGVGIPVTLEEELRGGFDDLFARASWPETFTSVFADCASNGPAERRTRRIEELRRRFAAGDDAERRYDVEIEERELRNRVLLWLRASRAASEERRVERRARLLQRRHET